MTILRCLNYMFGRADGLHITQTLAPSDRAQVFIGATCIFIQVLALSHNAQVLI